MDFDIVRVTPAVAAQWLAKPWVRQRTPSPAVVRKYARAMSEGRWEEPSLDPIGFTPTGVLGNGQHRLQAVIDAGWSGDMLIAYNVPEENFLVVDTGRKRTAGPVVRYSGKSQKKANPMPRTAAQRAAAAHNIKAAALKRRRRPAMLKAALDV